MEEKSRPLLSVIIPSLHQSEDLRSCLSSVLSSIGGMEFEIIIVCPTSEIEKIDLASKEIRKIAETRPNIYGAMNDGIKASRGKYLYFLGQDDRMLESFVDLFSIIEKKNSDLIIFDVIWGQKGKYRNSPSKHLLLIRNMCHQGIVYKRTLFEEFGNFATKFKVQADHYFNLKLLWAKNRTVSIEYSPHAAAYYSGDGYSSKNVDDKFWKLYPLILKRNVGLWAFVAVSFYRALWMKVLP